MRYVVIAAIVLCFLVSCGENEAGGSVQNTATTPASAPTLSNPSTPVNPNNAILPASNPSAPIIAGGKLNPAHGQPGHRCDIAVGAPLPAANATPAANTPTLNAPVLNNPTTAAPTVAQPQPVQTVAKGLNPPHGQPGHRCDIPVGESLSKAPAKNTTTASSPVITPTKPLVEVPDTMFAKGLNPAHGKPGHRCDIAVGQPLTSKPKKDSVKAN